MAWLLALLQVASITLLPHAAMSLVPAPRTCAGLAKGSLGLARRRNQQWQLSMAAPSCEEVKSKVKVSSQTTLSRAMKDMTASALFLLSLSRAAWAIDSDSTTGSFPVTCISTRTSSTYISRSNERPALSTFTLSTATERPTSISDYLGRVFASPNNNNRDEGSFNAIPAPTDPTYDSKEARNRAYDAAFEQDARDRDAYYGRLAMEKRRRAEEDVAQFRKQLGLDGPGDVRPRVGDEKVAGMASLKEYLLQQDPATLTPEELKVYQRLKQKVDED